MPYLCSWELGQIIGFEELNMEQMSLHSQAEDGVSGHSGGVEESSFPRGRGLTVLYYRLHF